MKGTTTDEGIFKEVDRAVNELNLNWRKSLSVTTDGCLSLIGKTKGPIIRIKNKIYESSPDQLLFFQYIIHQQVLYKNILELDDVLKAVIRIVNYSISSELNRRVHSIA